MPPDFIKPERLEEEATRFLAKYHPSLGIPIPIEEIVEFGLGLNIVPEENLYRECELEGWLSHDETAIHVDAYQFMNMEQRYRFTLAHELSHLLLHFDVYQNRAFRTLADWLAFQESIDPDRLYNWEWQARNLAGRILVPTAPLVRVAQVELDRQSAKIPEDIRRDALWQYLAIPVADVFNVSQSVVYYRLSGDRIGERLRVSPP